MEDIIFSAIAFIFIGGGIVYALILGLVEHWREKVRDKAAREVLKDFDFEKVKKDIGQTISKYIPVDRKCPDCSNLLVARSGKFGDFWGCRKYPMCHFSKKI